MQDGKEPAAGPRQKGTGMQRKRLHLGADAARKLGYAVLLISALGAHELALLG
jgi:hypothetical protein